MVLELEWRGEDEAGYTGSRCLYIVGLQRKGRRTSGATRARCSML